MKSLWIALCLGVLTAGIAAASVTYSATGSFSCTNTASYTCSGSTLTLDASANETITLTYSNLNSTNNTVNALSGTVASYGDFLATCAGTECTSSTPTAFVFPTNLIVFNLTISETAPDSSGGFVAVSGSGVLGGNLSENSSSASINWNTAISILTVTGTDNVTYTPLAQQFLVPPSSGGGDTALQMQITDANAVQNSAPEPATFGMLGIALLGLGAFARRRKA